MASSFPSPPPPSTSAGDPTNSVSKLLPDILIITALLAFALLACVSIRLLLRYLSRSSSPDDLAEMRGDGPEGTAEAGAGSAAEGGKKEEGGDEKQRLIDSLPRFTMASALAALPKSSPDCAVCLSPFTPDAELRLLPACRHAFHAACVDAWLRTTPTCPLCRATVALPHPSLSAVLAAEQQPPPPPPEPARSRDRSIRVEMGSVSSRGSSPSSSDGSSRTYSLGSFHYHIDEEVEAVLSRMARAAARGATVKEEKPAAVIATPPPPGLSVAEAAGSSPRGWLMEYVDRVTSTASSFTFSGRGSSRSSQQRQEEPWLWDAEAAAAAVFAPGSDEEEEETAFMVLYRWIAGV